MDGVAWIVDVILLGLWLLHRRLQRASSKLRDLEYLEVNQNSSVADPKRSRAPSRRLARDWWPVAVAFGLIILIAIDAVWLLLAGGLSPAD